MWLIIARSRHLPFYMPGRLDCVNDAATQQVSRKCGLCVPHCYEQWWVSWCKQVGIVQYHCTRRCKCLQWVTSVYYESQVDNESQVCTKICRCVRGANVCELQVSTKSCVYKELQVCTMNCKCVQRVASVYKESSVYKELQLCTTEWQVCRMSSKSTPAL